MKNLFRKTVFVDQLLKVTKWYYTVITTPKDFSLQPSDKCLILAPHADDESIGCGGMMVKYPENFSLVCLTDGRLSGSLGNQDETIEIRKKEFEAAMQLLNISEYSFLGIEDKKLINNYNKFSSIDISKYDYIFLPNHLDQHPDHKSTTPLLQKLMKNSRYKSTLKIGFYEVWSSLCLPNFFVDISGVVDKKKELISKYKSQLDSINYDERILSLNNYRGMARGIDYAEALTLIDAKTFLEL